MRHWNRLLIAAAAPLLLTGCLWSPGKFTSDLALRKNGTFVLDYRGEILLELPDDKDNAAEPWSADKARCFKDGRVEVDSVAIAEPAGEPSDEARDCTRRELEAAKSNFEKKQAEQREKKRTESAQMAKLFGLPGQDDESNRRFAANLMKYKGWRAVRYVGKGVFDVDYHLEGRTDQDFAFPLMPDSDLLIPFIAIRRRADGSVMVSAPAFSGGTGPFSARAKALGLPDKGSGQASRAVGRFTVTTDGEILTNNSEDGPSAAPSGRQVHWDVGPGSTKVPEMLVRL